MAKDEAEKERKASIGAIPENFPTGLSSLTAGLTTAPLPSSVTSYPTGLTMLPSGCREEQSAQFLTEKFKEHISGFERLLLRNKLSQNSVTLFPRGHCNERSIAVRCNNAPTQSASGLTCGQ
ncbi:hypothetical protein CEXT_811531 [Caerostris extrusa]|uniref:Uncharacterized protein n=1 Tax=Caerostris extrusa TaxID=172846 RepID=A0AAV4WU30_CAEEX|nr:hypothetical protein CEXT_811531 [Caerostris extrusa]